MFSKIRELLKVFKELKKNLEKKKNLLLKITFKINDSICDSVITEYLFPYSCLTSQLQSHDVSVNKHFKTEKRNY